MSFEERQILYQHAVVVGQKLFPAAGARVGNGRGDNAIIFCVLIRADIKKSVTVVNIVLVIFFAREDNCQWDTRPIGWEITELCRIG